MVALFRQLNTKPYIPFTFRFLGASTAREASHLGELDWRAIR